MSLIIIKYWKQTSICYDIVTNWNIMQLKRRGVDISVYRMAETENTLLDGKKQGPEQVACYLWYMKTRKSKTVSY